MNLEPLLDTLMLDAPERDRLRQALDSAPPEHGLRAVWFIPMEEGLREEAPRSVPAYERFASRLGRARAFAYIPLAHALLTVARITTLLPGAADDRRPLQERTNAFVERCMTRMFRTTMLRALHQACGGDLKIFLEMSTQSHSIFYDHGHSFVEVLGPQRLTMHYEGHHPLIERYFVPGYFRGVAREFAWPGEVRFVATDGGFEVRFEDVG